MVHCDTCLEKSLCVRSGLNQQTRQLINERKKKNMNTTVKSSVAHNNSHLESKFVQVWTGLIVDYFTGHAL